MAGLIADGEKIELVVPRMCPAARGIHPCMIESHDEPDRSAVHISDGFSNSVVARMSFAHPWHHVKAASPLRPGHYCVRIG